MGKNEKMAPFGDFKVLQVEKIRPDPNQPRKKFNEESLKELSKSVSNSGVLELVTVRPASQDGMCEIITGERRWRAARMAGLAEMPVLVRNMDDVEAFEAQVAENLPHLRLDLDVLEKAYAIKRLVDHYKDQKIVGERLGKTQGWVSQALSILDVPEEIMRLGEDKVVKDKTTLVMINNLMKDSPEAAHDLIEHAKANGGITRNEVSAKLHSVRGTQPKKRSKQESSAAVAASYSPAAEAGAPVVPPITKKPGLMEKVKAAKKRLKLKDDISMDELLEKLLDEVLRVKKDGVGGAT